jgi:hypothetical protein
VNEGNHGTLGWALEGEQVSFSQVDKTYYPEPNPPLGLGALRYEIPNTGVGRARYRALDGEFVRRITRIEYSTLISAGAHAPHVVLEIDIAEDNIDRADHVLVYLPPSHPQHQWTAWNALAGVWTLYTGSEEATGATPRQYTWSQYTSEFPMARLASRGLDPGSFSLDMGDVPGQLDCVLCVSTPESYDAYADALTLQVLTTTNLYDFEP